MSSIPKGKVASKPKVTCTECSKPFEIDLKDRPLPGGGAQQRFQCPHCKKYYIVANISPEGIRIRQQLRAAEAQLAGKPGDEALAAEVVRLKGLLAVEVTKPG